MDYDVDMDDAMSYTDGNARSLGKRPREQGSSEDSDTNNQLGTNQETPGENRALVLFNPDNTRQISVAEGFSRSLVTSAKGKEPHRPKKKVKNIETPSRPSSSNLGAVRKVFRNIYASALFGGSSAPEGSSSHTDTLPRSTQPAQNVPVEGVHTATEPLTSGFGSPEAGSTVTADPLLLTGAEDPPVQNPPSQHLRFAQFHSDTDRNNNISGGVDVVDAEQPSRSESTMRGARRRVTFTSHVQIMPMGGVYTAAAEPVASCPDSPESDSAIIEDPVLLTDHNSSLASRSGNSDSEVDDTDRTDDIGAEPPSRRGRTFMPASKDDLDTISTRLSRIETQMTDIKTAVESRRSSNETVYDAADDADTEENSSRRPFKKTGPLKHRPQRLNKFHELIRNHAQILMKRTDDDAQFTGVILPHEPLLTEFNPRRGACCTVENFTVDILGKPKSQWNISATKIFASDFVAHHPNYSVDKVSEAFATHLRSLKRAFQRTGLEDAALKARQKDDRRKERKRSLYHRRLNVAREVSDLRHHVQMLMRMGPEGMSSDETANENDTPQYRILGRHWRSIEVTPWLRMFDVMYRHKRWGPVATVSRGNNARVRLESMYMGHPGRGVCRLPRNTYRAEWYDSLDQYDREALDRCEDEVYAFTHVPEIQLAAQRTNGEPSHLRRYT